MTDIIKSDEFTKLGNFSSVEDVFKWAKVAIDSSLLPNSISTPEQVLIIMQHGRELGLTPQIALNNIHVISGRPTLSSSILGSLLKRRGIEWIWDEDFVTVKGDNGEIEKLGDGSANKRTTIHFYWKSKVTDNVMEARHSVTWAQMAIAGYITKDNWKKYPKEMMRARCLSYAVRALFPEVLSGFYTDLEINDTALGNDYKVEVSDEGDLHINYINKPNEQ